MPFCVLGPYPGPDQSGGTKGLESPLPCPSVYWGPTRSLTNQGEPKGLSPPPPTMPFCVLGPYPGPDQSGGTKGLESPPTMPFCVLGPYPGPDQSGGTKGLESPLPYPSVYWGLTQGLTNQGEPKGLSPPYHALLCTGALPRA